MCIGSELKSVRIRHACFLEIFIISEETGFDTFNIRKSSQFQIRISKRETVVQQQCVFQRGATLEMGGSADLRDFNQAPVLAFSLLRIEAGRAGMVPETSRKVKQAANGEDLPVETGNEWQGPGQKKREEKRRE